MSDLVTVFFMTLVLVGALWVHPGLFLLVVGLGGLVIIRGMK
jgi:hypothetical protein